MTRPDKDNDATPAQGDVVSTTGNTAVTGYGTTHDRAHKLTELFRNAPRVDGNVTEVRQYVRDLYALGMILVPLQRRGKLPTANDWTTTPPRTADAFLDLYRPGHNIGVLLGASNLIVVDADTDDEVDALHLWAVKNNDGTRWPNSPTVATPGVADKGETKHANGGHWYICVDTLPDDAGDVPLKGGTSKAVAMTGGRQVLLPGCVRDNVADPNVPNYVTVGKVLTPDDAPGVVKSVTDKAEGKRARKPTPPRAARSSRAGAPPSPVSVSPVDRWAENTLWADLLEPDGWENTGDADQCGCDTWTAPGVHASPKSATAHDGTCQHSSTGGALQIWTSTGPDNLPGGDGRVSKFDYVLATRYGVDFSNGVPDRPADVVAAAKSDLRIDGGYSMTRTGNVRRTFPDPRRDDGVLLEQLDADEWVELDVDELHADLIRELVDPITDALSNMLVDDFTDDDHVAALIDQLTPEHLDAARDTVARLDDTTGWETDARLIALRDVAVDFGVRPLALLSRVVCEAAVHIPRNVVVGGVSHVSLNLYALTVAESGGNKSTSGALADAVIRSNVDVTRLSNFSGQGFVAALEPKTEAVLDDEGKPAVYPDGGKVTRTVPSPPTLFSISEVSTLLAGMSNSTSTHMGTLNTSWFGQHSGDRNKTATSTQVDAHSYRVCLSAEGQPDIVRPLVTGENMSSGLTQRMTLNNPTVPGRAAMVIDLLAAPDIGAVDAIFDMVDPRPGNQFGNAAGLYVYPFDDDVERKVRTLAARHRARPKVGQNHAVVMRKKIAVVLAWLIGRPAVDMTVWSIACQIYDHSYHELIGLHRRYKEHEDDAAIAAGEAAERRALKQIDKDVAKVKTWLTGEKGKEYAGEDPGGWVSWANVTRGPGRPWSPERRAAVREVLEGDPAVEVEAVEYRGQWGYRIRLA